MTVYVKFSLNVYFSIFCTPHFLNILTHVEPFLGYRFSITSVFFVFNRHSCHEIITCIHEICIIILIYLYEVQCNEVNYFKKTLWRHQTRRREVVGHVSLRKEQSFLSLTFWWSLILCNFTRLFSRSFVTALLHHSLDLSPCVNFTSKLRILDNVSNLK